VKKLEKSLTIEELRNLLIADYWGTLQEEKKLWKRLREVAGEVTQELPKISEVFNNQIVSRLAEITANHLLNKTPAAIPVHFLSVEDLKSAALEEENPETQMVMLIALHIAGEEVVELAEKWFWLQWLRFPQENFYETYWRWIEAVLERSEEQGISPIELVKNQEERDEITRRIFNPEEFSQYYERRFKEWKEYVEESSEKQINILISRREELFAEVDEDEEYLDEDFKENFKEELEEWKRKMRESLSGVWEKVNEEVEKFVQERIREIWG
jgi:hypothetical protein